MKWVHAIEYYTLLCTKLFHRLLLFTSCYFSVFVSIRFTVSSKITLTIIFDITQHTLLRLNVTIVQFCKKLLAGKLLRNLIRHSSSLEERVSKKRNIKITIFPQIIAGGDYFSTKRGRIFEGRQLFEGGDYFTNKLWKSCPKCFVLFSH